MCGSGEKTVLYLIGFFFLRQILFTSLSVSFFGEICNEIVYLLYGFRFFFVCTVFWYYSLGSEIRYMRNILGQLR